MAKTKKYLSVILALVMIISMLVIAPITASAEVEITSIEIDNIVEPVVGAHPFGQIGLPTNVTLHELDWYNETDSRWMENEDTFELGKEYSVKIFLQANSGYEFPVKENMPDVAVTINGKEAIVTGGSNWEPNEGLCAKLIFDLNTKITSLDITNIIEPQVGAKRSKQVTLPENVSLYDIGWFNVTDKTWMLKDDATFEAGKVYKVSVYIQADEGYKFPVKYNMPDVTATINGKQAKISMGTFADADKGLVATLEYSLKTEITAIDVTNVIVPVAGAHPSDVVGTVQDYVVIDDYGWYNLTDKSWMGSEDIYELGKEYQALVYLKPASAYKFAVKDGMPDVKATIDGKEATVVKYSTFAPDEALVAKITFALKKDISDWKVTGVDNLVYKGKALTHDNIIIMAKNGECAIFTAKYKNNVNAGKATVILTGTDIYTGTIVKTFTILKAQNPAKFTFKAKVKANDDKKTTIKNAVKVKKPQGKVTYKTNNKKVKISKGKMIVSKGLKKGKTYKVKVTVKVAGNKNYKSRKVVETIKVKIK